MKILSIVDWISGRIAGIGARFRRVATATAVFNPPGVGDNVGGALEPDRCVLHRRIEAGRNVAGILLEGLQPGATNESFRRR